MFRVGRLSLHHKHPVVHHIRRVVRNCTTACSINWCIESIPAASASATSTISSASIAALSTIYTQRQTSLLRYVHRMHHVDCSPNTASNIDDTESIPIASTTSTALAVLTIVKRCASALRTHWYIKYIRTRTVYYNLPPLLWEFYSMIFISDW